MLSSNYSEALFFVCLFKSLIHLDFGLLLDVYYRFNFLNFFPKCPSSCLNPLLIFHLFPTSTKSKLPLTWELPTEIHLFNRLIVALFPRQCCLHFCHAFSVLFPEFIHYQSDKAKLLMQEPRQRPLQFNINSVVTAIHLYQPQNHCIWGTCVVSTCMTLSLHLRAAVRTLACDGCRARRLCGCPDSRD